MVWNIIYESVNILSYPSSIRSRSQPLKKKKFTSLSIIHQIRNTQYGRNRTDELRWECRTFVGICYVFTYPHRYKVILKYIFFIRRPTETGPTVSNDWGTISEIKKTRCIL